ncbi:MAG: DMT family transporter, partial [Gemmatimonadaceae bacterium]
MTAARMLALLLSLTGIAVIIGTPSVGVLRPVGVVLALISALAYAMYIPLIGYYQVQLSESIAAVYSALGAGVLLVLADLFTNHATVILSGHAWMAIGTMGLWSTAIAFIAFLRGLRVLGPVRTAIISTVEPFWTALLGASVLGQHLTMATLSGGVLIAAAVILLQIRPSSGSVGG